MQPILLETYLECLLVTRNEFQTEKQQKHLDVHHKIYVKFYFRKSSNSLKFYITCISKKKLQTYISTKKILSWSYFLEKYSKSKFLNFPHCVLPTFGLFFMNRFSLVIYSKIIIFLVFIQRSSLEILGSEQHLCFEQLCGRHVKLQFGIKDFSPSPLSSWTWKSGNSGWIVISFIPCFSRISQTFWWVLWYPWNESFDYKKAWIRKDMKSLIEMWQCGKSKILFIDWKIFRQINLLRDSL